MQLALEPIRTGAWSIDALRAAAEPHEIAILSGMLQMAGEDYSSIERIRQTGGIRPDHLWEQNLANARRDADIASQLGLPLVSFHAGFIPARDDDPLHQVMIDRLVRIGEVFATKGIRLALETGQESAEAMLGIMNNPMLSGLNLGVNFDPANMILYGSGNPVAALRLLRAHVAQVHLKDAVESERAGQTWGEEVPLGRGDVDWPAFFAAVDDGPAIHLMIEREGGRQRESDIITAKELAKTFGHRP